MANDVQVTMRAAYEESLANIDWEDDTLVALLLTGWSTDLTVDYLSSIAAYEVDVTGYTRQVLSNVTVTLNDSTHKVTIDCDDITWANIDPVTTSHFVVAKWTGLDATSPVLLIVEATKTHNGGQYQVTVPLTGLFYKARA